MFEIGADIGELVNDANKLRDVENSIRSADNKGIQLEVTESSKRLRIPMSVWETGLDFQNAVKQLKKLAII